MTRPRSFAIVGIVVALGAALAWSPARAERLIVSVSNHRVTVTPNYSGEELVLPGTVQAFTEAPIYARTNGY